jgi:hypothetical protein
LWTTELVVFIVGVIALAISCYYLRKYFMTNGTQSTVENVRNAVRTFGDSLFQYYSVILAQGSWKSMGHVNVEGHMRNHINILHVVLGVTLIFGSCLYQGVVLTASLFQRHHYTLTILQHLLI